MDDLLFLASNLALLDELHEQQRRDPAALEPGWRRLLDLGLPAAPAPRGAMSVAEVAHLGRVFMLVNAYRVRGHLEASLDPLGTRSREAHPDLDPRSYGFTDRDLDRIFPSGGLHGLSEGPLREILRRLRETYCATIGVEMQHISIPERRAWLAERMELVQNRPLLDPATRLHLLERLVAAETFEHFIHVKYVGTKRFSLEGGDALIPLLDLALERAGEQGVEEAVIGMAHRGRLNVLANILDKGAADLFAEFEDIDPESVLGGGDVKYHLGYSTDRTTRLGHTMHLSLAFNPSHLEAVDPVVVGRVRAKQRRRRDWNHRRVLGLLLHGDAAFSGQGLVAETLNLAELQGYRTGGTLHVIVNNQIGFTTSPAAARSTPYPTDVAKGYQVPIFHVNGDDPEAVVQVVRLAMDYRHRFQSDVVIDLFCFRRYGHNEGDEPSFTQPLLYQRIESHPTTAELYAKILSDGGTGDGGELAALRQRHAARLDAEFTRAQRRTDRPQVDVFSGYWRGYTGGVELQEYDVETGVPRDRLQGIADRISTLPPGFHAHPKIVRLLHQRAAMGRGQQPLDWGMAETLAYGSLLVEGHLVRVSGQDCRRGTFSHRHATVVDVTNGSEYTPLAHLKEGQAEFVIYDSSLSEAAVLGFELGYSLDWPDGLVMWEAQFGDFANGAQVIIDQFLAASEDKWRRLSGLVMLLPHGYEGQGPEHSSARLERFLQLCAEDNLQVAQPTTPAQMYHLLRRQVHRRWRKPLVIMTPKSLLRLPEARSSLEELTAGRFQRVLDDAAVTDREAVDRLIVCTGKVYYDLHAERRERQDRGVAILRLEQLYPLPDAAVQEIVDRYPNAKDLVWVQEEPSNMGANHFLHSQMYRLAKGRAVLAVTRAESASPATGSNKAHLIEQADLLARAFRRDGQ